MDNHSHQTHFISCKIYRIKFASRIERFSDESRRLAERVKSEGWTEELRSEGRILKAVHDKLYEGKLTTYTSYADELLDMGVLDLQLRHYYLLEY